MEHAAKIRTVVCDDEPDAREGIVDLLRRDPDVLLVAEARNGSEAATAIRDLAPDVVFLDVQMPKLDGFAVLAGLPPSGGSERAPVIVFVTAYDEYALRAFGVHALDYLLKPFSDARFAEALAAAKARVRERRACALGLQIASLLRPMAANRTTALGCQPSTASAPPGVINDRKQYLEHFMVRVGGKVTLLRVDDVDWIEADDYYAKLHVAGRAYLLRETMQQLEAKLDPAAFVRVHRSSIVHIDRVRTLEPYIKGSHVLTLRDGTRLTLSRGRKAGLEMALGSRL
jgi:two-component system, LytTR family, response regulator